MNRFKLFMLLPLILVAISSCNEDDTLIPEPIETDYRANYLGQWNFHTVRITQVLHTYPGQPPVVRDTVEYDYLGYVAAAGSNEIEVNYREGIFKFYPIDSLGEFSIQTYYWDGGSFSDSTHVSFDMRYGGLGDWYTETVVGTR